MMKKAVMMTVLLLVGRSARAEVAGQDKVLVHAQPNVVVFIGDDISALERWMVDTGQSFNRAMLYDDGRDRVTGAVNENYSKGLWRQKAEAVKRYLRDNNLSHKSVRSAIPPGGEPSACFEIER